MPGTNTLAQYQHSYITDVKTFVSVVWYSPTSIQTSFDCKFGSGALSKSDYYILGKP
jgi:hypothetical protein